MVALSGEYVPVGLAGEDMVLPRLLTMLLIDANPASRGAFTFLIWHHVSLIGIGVERDLQTLKGLEQTEDPRTV